MEKVWTKKTDKIYAATMCAWLNALADSGIGQERLEELMTMASDEYERMGSWREYVQKTWDRLGIAAGRCGE